MSSSVTEIPKLQTFKGTKAVISRFVLKRTSRGAIGWSLAFGAIVASKAAGYAAAYPTMADRAKITSSFASNIGLKVILGQPNQIQLVSGFAVWNTLNVMVIVGSIWGLLVASRTFRGDEVSGRWEMLISGPVTKRRATSQALLGLGGSIAILLSLTSLGFALIGRLHTVNFSLQGSVFFAVCAVSGAAMFMAVATLASQIMPTRTRAASLSAAIFGLCFLLRAVGDITSAHWLLAVSPLGWIEKMQPLYGSQPMWLVPIVVLIAFLVGLSVYLSGKRDLGEALVADKDSARAHTSLLNRPLPLAFRLTRAHSLSWLVGISLAGLFFGALTKSAEQAFNASVSAQKLLSHIAHASQNLGGRVFLSIIFMLLMLLVMAYTASALGKIREDEAEGYLDNLVVRPVSRLQWLSGRVILIVLTTLAAGALISLTTWLAITTQRLGFGYSDLFKASINGLVPGLFILGWGLFGLGVIPRLTTVLSFGLIAWSFLINILSSGINLNHWIADTSLFTHVSLAPATPIKWSTNAILIGLALALGLIGAIRFNRRDLQSE